MRSFTLIEILIVIGVLAILVGLSMPALNLFKKDLNSSLPDTFLPSDTSRLKDSRHIHFDYSRVISLPAEKLTLIFSDPPNLDVSQDIMINDNLIAGQISWEGQNIKIQTHRLNNPDTQFSVHRDRRYHSQALRIIISGDVTGDLIQYQSDGQTVKGASIYVANPNWQ